MAVSIFDLFKIGIGPSSSHTVGPMRAARLFVQSLSADGLLTQTASVKVGLYGSLGATGKGHGTDKGIILGLYGESPDTVDPEQIQPLLDKIQVEQRLALLNLHSVPFIQAEHLLFYRREAMAEHPNGMKFFAFNQDGEVLREARYLSIGGGFVVNTNGESQKDTGYDSVPWPFRSGRELLAMSAQDNKSIAQLMWDNECTWRTPQSIEAGLLRIWQVMQDCVVRGCNTAGTLPGTFQVKRRAPELFQHLTAQPQVATDPLSVIDWVNLYAIATNEENAAGGRVVTAPTNGAAGIIPAVLHYHQRFIPGADLHHVRDFLLTAGAIGILYKLNASISGAEVGCQGEVGVACSMAAGALAAVLGGTTQQIENAAEIGMEHNLGLTCDPVGGLVQIPCIERNAMGAVKAINAARMALQGDGKHYVSLDSVIKTMRETGADMKTKYKETARGGLAVNIVEC